MTTQQFKGSLIFTVLTVLLYSVSIDLTSCSPPQEPQSNDTTIVIDSSKIFYEREEVMIGNPDTIYEIFNPETWNFRILKFSIDNKEYTIIHPMGDIGSYQILNVDTTTTNTTFYKK